MLIDQVTIYVKSGDGGNGCISFRREAHVPHGGPDGGDGGKGGDVIIEASSHLTTLIALKYHPHYRVNHAGHGKGKGCTGRGSEDIIIPVPVGTVVKDAETDELWADFTRHGQQAIVAKGGKGGRGNIHFKTPILQAPQIADDGIQGEEKWLVIELKLLADVGLVGLPNAGKSTLISTLSASRPKIADYPFTTLEPNLGVVVWGGLRERNQFTVADVPGLISGAHAGKGLGIQFLRHLERTSLLVHLVDISLTAGNPVEAFEDIQKEVTLYGHGLDEKPFIVIATKIDMEGKGEKTKRLEQYCNAQKIPFYKTSAATGKGIKTLIQAMGREVIKLKTLKDPLCHKS